MAHEHLLKAHIYLHTASGDTPVLEYRRLRFHLSKLVTSRFFQKWCSSGVVSALLLQRTTDFTGFFRTFRDTAVAHKKDLLHTPDTPHALYFLQYIQSARSRQRAASYKASYSVPGLSLANPSRIAASSIEEIHSRSNGFLQPH